LLDCAYLWFFKLYGDITMIYALMTFTAIMMALCYITYPNAKLVEKIAATIVMGICMGVISLAAYFIYLMIMALFV